MYDIKINLIQSGVITSTNQCSVSANSLRRVNATLYDELVNATNFLPTTASIRERIYAVITNITEVPKCIECEKPVSFRATGKHRNTYGLFCSLQCSNKSVYTSQKRKDTNLCRHGVDNVSKSVAIHQKKLSTSVSRYGTEYPWQSNVVKAHKSDQLLEKYGVPNVSQILDIRTRAAHTRAERHGGDGYGSITTKTKATTLVKYGVDHTNQRHIPIDVLHKLDDQEWLRTQHHTLHQTVNEIARRLQVSPSTVSRYMQTHNIPVKQFARSPHDDSQLMSMLRSPSWLHHQHHELKQPIDTIAAEIGIDDTTLHKYYKKAGVTTRRFPTSGPEQDIVALLHQHGINDIVTNTRTIISPLEIDIYIPSLKVAIEYCGLYWHSDEHKAPSYHLNKLRECERRGIRLITIFEDEWIHHNDPVTAKILSVVGVDPRESIHARKCFTTSVSKDEKRMFHDRFHIQGDGPSTVDYGLRSPNGNLVAVASFLRQRTHHVLNRYSTGARVPGGASRLISLFKRSNQWTKLVSFADRRWSSGTMYDQTGWILDGTTPPDYSYIQGNTRIHKSNFRHSNMHKRLSDYDPTLSEAVNTQRHNIRKIYGCGLLRYVMYNSSCPSLDSLR